MQTDLFANNLVKFIEVLNDINFIYPNGPTGSSPIRSPFLFRGMNNSAFELLPSIFRESKKKISEDMVIKNSLYTSYASEKTILYDFRNEASGFIKGLSYDDYIHWAEYAQHYGVPTRFLDWTSNPLVALFFACIGSLQEDGVVWCLHAQNFRRFVEKNEPEEKRSLHHDLLISEIYSQMIDKKDICKYPFVYTPFYVEQRMNAQGSHFMIWGFDERPLESIIPIENYIEYEKPVKGIRSYGTKQTTEILLKISINAAAKQSILRDLDLIGINSKTLFPGLDGVGQYLRWKYTFDYNEAVRSF